MTQAAEGRKAVSAYFMPWLARWLARTPVTPNAITWIGFLVAIGAAVLIFTGNLFAAGFVVLLAGFFDILDGALARQTQRTTRFGAVLDSTLDRLGEAVQLLALLGLFLLAGGDSYLFTLVSREWAAVLVGVTLIGSLMVSYIRARAEAVGYSCQVGLFTRTERVIMLALGLLLSRIEYALIIALLIIAVFSFVTVGQRLFHVWRQTKH